MDTRTILAIALSIAILIGYQFFVERSMPPATKEAPPAQGVPGQPQTAPQQSPSPQAPPAPVPASAPSAQQKSVTVENKRFKALLSSRGATVRSVELKDYRDEKDNPIVLKGDEITPALSLGLDESFQFSQADFSVRGKDVTLSPAAAQASVVFEYASGGYSIRRTYTFSYDDYGFTVKDEVSGPGSYWITLGRDFGIHARDDSVHFGPVILKNADREEFEVKSIKEPKEFREGVKWAAQEDKYFFSVIVPKSPVELARVWKKDDYAMVGLKLPAGQNEYLMYAGPKEYDRLKTYGHGLEHIVDFGWFSFLAVPLFWVLKLFYSVVHNYGTAIIILTVLVRIPFIPIVNKGQKSMKKLQDLQPRIAEIREKHKKDPQTVQREIMELYKKNKVNPMGGCLPIVLQIPVFFALYKVLLIAIELRGAPFMFWIKDLSAMDPYYILPIIMGVTMVIQQKMTPSGMDPKQQKIMMLMPVVFTFLFLNFASGLVLYWLANNVLSIVQQYFVNRKLEKQAA
jgi:YidC/Oxa1 family membrane protein insertase